ncbi:MAG: HDOD domain-containing protein [Myxococcales bacterium]|nr:HDOD domain-containing protein [Myxococcales bacterium]
MRTSEPLMTARELVEHLHEVCPLPANAQRVLALTGSPRATMEEVGAALSSDPALAAEVMRVASSPAYAGAVPPADLQAAAVRLGMSELRDLAAAAAMLAAFPTHHELALSVHDRSVFAAELAVALATELGHRRPRTVYLCGLLAELGVLACLAVDDEVYAALRDYVDDDPTLRAFEERARYGTTSWAIGAALLRNNGISEMVCGAIENAPDADDPLAGHITQFVRFAMPIVFDGAEGDPEWLERLGRLAEDEELSVPLPRLQALVLSASHASIEKLRQRMTGAAA